MIKKIQAETGARVQFQQGREDGPGDRKCIVSGKHQAVEQVRQRIQELIDSVMVIVISFLYCVITSSLHFIRIILPSPQSFREEMMVEVT